MIDHKNGEMMLLGRRSKQAHSSGGKGWPTGPGLLRSPSPGGTEHPNPREPGDTLRRSHSADAPPTSNQLTTMAMKTTKTTKSTKPAKPAKAAKPVEPASPPPSPEPVAARAPAPAPKPAKVSVVPAPAPHGVTFRLSRPSARSVAVAGTFNTWNPSASALRRGPDGVWSVSLTLAPGQYEYRFVVDGEWISDPAASETAPNPFGGVNSVILVEPC